MRAKWVMLQNKNKMVNPLAKALIRLMPVAAFSGPKGTINNLPINTNSGAPGGWGICSLKALEANSPQSQRLPVASMVIIYTAHAIMQMIHPVMLLMRLKLINMIWLYPDTYREANIMMFGVWCLPFGDFLQPHPPSPSPKARERYIKHI